MNKLKYLLILLALLPATLRAQEIDMADLSDFFNRINSGQLLPGDLSALEYLRRYETDSLIIRKTFGDKNGENQLHIKVVNPCRLAGDNYRVDGAINYIVVRLNNKNYSDTLTYYNPGFEMSLINLIESNITFKPIAGKQAVFIPFTYCGNADDDIRITYIVFYDHQKYFYHINLRGQEFSNYKIVDNLDEKFKDLPSKLKKEFIGLVRSQYTKLIWFEEESAE